MNAEFNWWLLIVGLVVGAALVWLVVADSTRREADLEERERADEAVWIAARLSGRGGAVPPERVEEVLRLHRDYLAGPPPDEPDAPQVMAQPRATEPEPETWPDRSGVGRDRETEPRGSV